MAMQTFDDDELNDVKPMTAQGTAASAAQPTQSKPQPQTAAAAEEFEDEGAPKSAAKAEDDSDIHDTDFDDEKVLARPGVLPRIRPGKDGNPKAVRMAFIKTVKMKSAKVHFVETGTGKEKKKMSARCLIPIGDESRGYCCNKLDKDSDIHIAALVLVYRNADPNDGKYRKNADGSIPPIEWELGYADLSGFNMKQIKKLPDEDSTPYDIDIIMTAAEGRAFGYEFNRASAKARWLQNPELIKEVEAACDRFRDGKTLVSKLGKKLNLIEWKALLSGTTSDEGSKLEDMNEL